MAAVGQGLKELPHPFLSMAGVVVCFSVGYKAISLSSDGLANLTSLYTKGTRRA